MLLFRGPRGSARPLRLVPLAVFLSLLAPGRVDASLAEALDLVALTDQAAHVVVADAVADAVGWDDRGRIVTDVTLRVVETFKGDTAPGAALVVRTFGGAIDGLGMRVTGAARIPVGARVLLFAHVAGDGWLRPVGMSQGVMRVVADDGGDDTVLPGGAGLHLVPPGSGGAGQADPALAAPTPLPRVRDTLRSLMGATRVR